MRSPRWKIVSIESRVVPGVSDTITRSWPRIAFRSDDLPTFGRPRIATRIASSGVSSRPVPGSASTMSSSRSPDAVPVQGGDGQRLAEAEPVQLERQALLRRIVDLVRDQEHGLARAAQDVGDLLVSRRDARRSRRRRRGRGRPRRPPAAPARRSTSSSATSRRCRRRRCRSAGSACRSIRRRAPCGRASRPTSRARRPRATRSAG